MGIKMMGCDILILKMSFGSLSYRNGKYQGFLNSSSQRQGLGIMIDDDLTFHVSNWQENKMQGATLVYLAHAKYIYGQWKNNQPHGLNVYRSGDTVLLSKYVFGVPSNRCLLIFERHGFGCVLSEQGKQWQVIKTSQLVNHMALMKLIQLLHVDVPEHYLSLIKFACTFSHSHNALRTFPCHQNNCYFGYVNGLAIIFNNNNGVVTIGQHRNETLCEFGGKFTSKRSAEQGNFSLNGETVQYKGDRPVQKIYQVYQKLHKRDANFVNEAFQSKIKMFNSIQSLIIDKLKQIVQESRRNEDVGQFNLQQSLDYHEYDEQESLRLDQLRDKMYSPPKKIFRKPIQSFTPSKLQIYTHNKNQSLLKRSIKQLIPQITSSNGKQMKQTKVFPSKVDKVLRFSEYTQQINTTQEKRINKKIQQTNKNLNQLFPLEHDSFDGLNIDEIQPNRLEQTSNFKRLLQEQQQKQRPLSSIKKSSKCLLLQQEIEEDEHISKERHSYIKREKSIEQFTRPTYQDIEQRRKRILREFQELNGGTIEITPKKEKTKIGDSPFKQHLISVERDEQSSFGYVPLSISNKLNQKRQSIKIKQQDKSSHQQSAQQERSRSSTRRANYNYSGLDSRALGSQNKQPFPTISATMPQVSVTPSRQKRKYEYMYV